MSALMMSLKCFALSPQAKVSTNSPLRDSLWRTRKVPWIDAASSPLVLKIFDQDGVADF